MDNAIRAEQKLKKICDSLGITPEGRKWLDVALDPFKDVEQRPSGYPDKTMARSVVQVFHSQLEITRPATVPLGSNWDCNIFTDTLWRPNSAKITTRTAGCFLKSGQTGTNASRGGLQIRSGPAGTPLLTEQATGSLSLPTDVFDEESDSRVIAWAFEVHDKTSPLKRQGAVITWRVSDDTSEATSANVINTNADVAVIQTTVPLYSLPEPPTTTAEAIDLPLSQEWKAEDGVYVVPLLNEPTNPLSQLKNIGFEAREGSNVYFNTITQTGVIQHVLQTNAKLPFTCSGAYFNGLSDESSLILNLTAYIEQFPSKSSALHRLTQMSCPQDNVAIELYTKIARIMPTGCPVDDNFLGAFISGIANAARAVIPHIPKILRGVGIATEVVSRTMDAFNPSGNQRTMGEHLGSSIQKEKKMIRDVEKVTNVLRNDVQRKENQIVPYHNNNNNREIIINRNNGNVVRNRQGSGIRMVETNTKNKRNKNYNRTAQLWSDVRQRDKGNRWVGK